ncbi:hypothetical protein GGI08_005290 [Coemansia sp. S2]|nr:hypothetical protein GGI08_005290 [Coemansia sp. S2]
MPPPCFNMQTESHFQRLPPHVVLTVVNHISHHSSMIFAESKALLMPLLWVCSNFRAVVYSKYSGSIHISLNRHHDILCYTWGVSSGFYVHSDYPEHHFARELKITLDEHSVYSGKMLEMLEKSYNASAFPMAHSVELRFSGQLDLKNSNIILPPLPKVSDIEANIDAFVQHTKRMAPKARDIRVSGYFGNESTPTILCRHMQYLLARLFMLTYRIRFDNKYQLMSIDLPVNDICNMVPINYEYHNGMGQIASLARRCASTLESLTIRGREFEDISGLIQNDDGTFATYYWLWTLCLEEKDVFHRPSQLAFKGAVPFPNLRHLHIKGRYLFGDDTPFRGNVTKLQSLQLMLVYKSLTPTSHPSLQHVKITRSVGLIRNSFDNNFDSYTRLVLQIGPGAAVREFGQFSSYSHHLQQAISMFGDHVCTQVLALPDTYMSLWEVLNLVKSLPLLTDLHTMEAHIHTPPADLAANEPPAYVLANYSSTPNRFQCWHLSFYMAFKVEVCARCLLLLALVCPNFNYITHRDLKPKQLLEKMVELCVAGDFKQHAQRLERLFGKWRHVEHIVAHGFSPSPR